MRNVLVLGGYGNFGKRISEALVRSGVPIIIAGRNQDKAQQLARRLTQQYAIAQVAVAMFDVEHGLDLHLGELAPTVVVNTCGPFQLKRYPATRLLTKPSIIRCQP